MNESRERCLLWLYLFGDQVNKRSSYMVYCGWTQVCVFIPVDTTRTSASVQREGRCVRLSVSTIDKTACHLQKWCLHALYWLTEKAASVYCGTALPAEQIPIPKKWENRACMWNVLPNCAVHGGETSRPTKHLCPGPETFQGENTWLSSWKVFSAEPFDVTVK